jgi:small subunit ribosomal protein S15
MPAPANLAAVKAKKAEIIANIGGSATNTGSAPVQIALLTERITQLTEHMKSHKKDFHSRRGLLALVSKRNRLLKYVSSQDVVAYRKLTEQLNIRQKV